MTYWWAACSRCKHWGRIDGYCKMCVRCPFHPCGVTNDLKEAIPQTCLHCRYLRWGPLAEILCGNAESGKGMRRPGDSCELWEEETE